MAKEKKKKKAIGLVVKGITLAALDIVNGLLVNKIPYEEVKNITALSILHIKKTIKVLADKDLNDSDQVAQVWLDFARSHELRVHLIGLINQAISKIQNSNLKEFISSLIGPILNTVAVLIDQDDQNAHQVANVWKIHFLNEDNIKALLNVFDPKENNTDALNGVASMLHLALSQILNEI